MLTARLVEALTISIAPTVILNQDAVVNWTRASNDPEGFDLYVNNNDLDTVDTGSGTSGTTSLLFASDSWKPGTYTLEAQFWM
jgi:hypothetical protein